MNGRCEEYFVAVRSGIDPLRFFVGPIEFPPDYIVIGNNSLSELFASLTPLTAEDVKTAAVAFGSYISRGSFESAIPEALRPDALALIQEVPFTSTEDAERAAFNSASRLKLKELNSWWDNIPGIEVKPGVVLAMDRGSIGAMGVAANFAIQTQTALSLDDVNDKTVVIPAQEIASCIGVFYAKYNSLRQKWDELLSRIESATTVEELQLITIE